jgi:hypothetical protein
MRSGVRNKALDTLGNDRLASKTNLREFGRADGLRLARWPQR